MQYFAETVYGMAGEQAMQCGHARFVQLVAIFEVPAEGLPRTRERTRANAELQPATAQLIERGRGFGDNQRILERKDVDTGAEVDPAGALRDRGQEHQRRRDVFVALAEVPVDDPPGVVPELLGGPEQ